MKITFNQLVTLIVLVFVMITYLLSFLLQRDINFTALFSFAVPIIYHIVGVKSDA
jgi:hypothetical protein